MEHNLYRWVKASERLPETWDAIFKTPDRDGLRSVFYLDCETDLKKFFSPLQLWEIEWLEPIESEQDELINDVVYMVDEFSIGTQTMKEFKQGLSSKYLLIKK